LGDVKEFSITERTPFLDKEPTNENDNRGSVTLKAKGKLPPRFLTLPIGKQKRVLLLTISS